MEKRSPVITLNLLLIFGLFGFHRFYLGRPISGLIQFFTVGGLGIWWTLDIHHIFTNKLTDCDGNIVTFEYTGEKVPAGFWIRFAAFFIDLAIISTVVFIITIPLFFILMNMFDLSILKEHYDKMMNISIENMEELQNLDRMLNKLVEISQYFNYLNLFATFLYFAILTASKHQASYGKRLVWIYVETANGGKITPLISTLRAAAYYISSYLYEIGFLMVGMNKRKLALHDLICGTRVYRGKPQS
jgi:uncharacterized RDD family membrane protein YckC/TM2 domain-containing membrane protein YozV